jgi:hypothetical protein
MIYELWYEDSPNIIDAFTTEAEPLLKYAPTSKTTGLRL